MLLGSLSKHDARDERSENVAEKMNFCFFKLKRIYLDPFNLSNVSDLKKESGKFAFVCSRSPQNVALEGFTLQWTSRKCTKKRDARAQLLYLLLNQLFF